MAEEALARKKKIRAAHRSSATRLMGQAGALIEATPINADELALMQTNLSGKLTTLEAANAEIVELTPEPQLEEEIGRADFFFFFFFSMKVYAKEAQGIQNSIKLMLLHPGVSISNDTQTQKDKHGYNTDSNVLLWYSYTIKLSESSK